MMPHAIRRVFVARRARTAASLVVCVGGVAMLVAGAVPSLMHALARGMPGINPAVLSTFVVATWIAGLFAYAAARALDEHRFAVAMSHYVLPSKDLDHDIERLSHERPDEAAREMAHRLEARSAALPVLAASLLLPVTALFVAQAIRAHGWPAIADFEASVAAHVKPLIASSIVGVVVAIVMTRQFARRPAMIPVAAAFTVANAIGAIVAWSWLATPALLALTIAIVVRKLGKERTLLAAEDPAAGSEVFTLRGFLRQLRTVAAHLKGGKGRFAIAWLAVLVAGLYPARSRPVMMKAAATVHMATQPATVANPEGSTYKVEALGDGRLRYTITLVDHQPLQIKEIHGLATVPPRWNATMEVEMIGDGALRVQLGQTYGSLDDPTRRASLSSPACDVELHPIGPSFTGAAGTYTVIVTPALQPAGC